MGKLLKKYMITGLLVWLPVAVTIWIISSIVGATDQIINLLPQKWRLETYLGLKVPGQGFLIAIVVLFVTGVLAANVLGRKILEGWDSLLGRIPVVKSIYSSVKKVSESLLSDNSRSFKTPVLVPFPQPNIWTIAFVSGSVPQSVSNVLPEPTDYVSVYVPTTPNPTGGYYIMVRQSDIRELDMTVDEALKYVISLGMVMPDELPLKHKMPPEKD
jgi:transmembrane protein